MKTIRKNVFETNSSSMHSISFSTEGSGHLDHSGITISLEGGSFGWEEYTYTSVQDKFSYWLSAFSDLAASQFYYIRDHNSSVDYITAFKEAVYDPFAEILIFFRDNYCNFHIYYNEDTHELEEYLIDFQNSNNCEKDSYGFDFLVEMGYGIDHQSGPGESTDAAKLAGFSPKEVFDWVFGDGSVHTDNDNH